MAKSQIIWRAPALDLSFTTAQLERAARSADASAKSFLAQVGQADKMATDLLRSVGSGAAKGVASGGALFVVEAAKLFVDLSKAAFTAFHARALEQSEGYRDLAKAAQGLLDATVASVLGSDVMQGVLSWLADSLVSLAGDFDGIATAVNGWISKGVPRAELIMAQLDVWQNELERAAVLVQRAFADAAQAALRLVRKAADGLRSLVDKTAGVLPDRFAKTLRRALDQASGFAIIHEAAVADLSRGLAKRAADLAAFVPVEYSLLKRAPGRNTEQEVRGGTDADLARTVTAPPEVTFYERLLDTLLEWGNSPSMLAVGRGLGDTFMRHGASLVELAKTVAATFGNAAQVARALGESMAPALVSTAALADAVGFASDQADVIARSNSAAARMLGRVRMAVLGTLALVRSAIEFALGVAAAATIAGAPKAALHFLASTLFAGAAALAFSGGGAAAATAPAVARAPAGGPGLAQPRAIGSITVIVQGDVAANDPEWVRTHLLEPIASGGSRYPAAARALQIDPTALERKTTEEAVAAILQQSTPALAGRALAGWLRLQSVWLDWAGLSSVASELRRTAGRIEREVDRTTSRVGREVRRIRRRLGF